MRVFDKAAQAAFFHLSHSLRIIRMNEIDLKLGWKKASDGFPPHQKTDLKLGWKKASDGFPPHQKTVTGWNTNLKVVIREIWWDENDGTWNTYEEYFEKDEISHWMEHPSAPEGEL